MSSARHVAPSHLALAASISALAVVSLALDLARGCAACGASSPWHAPIAGVGAVAYGLLALSGRRGCARAFYPGVFAAGAVHATLLAWMAMAGAWCVPCLAACAASFALMALSARSGAARPRAVAAAFLTTLTLASTASALLLRAAEASDRERLARIATSSRTAPSAVADPAAASPAPAARTRDGVLHLVVYEREGCHFCKQFRDDMLPRIRDEFGSRIAIEFRPASSDPAIRRTPTTVLENGVVVEGAVYDRLRDAVAQSLADPPAATASFGAGAANRAHAPVAGASRPAVARRAAAPRALIRAAAAPVAGWQDLPGTLLQSVCPPDHFGFPDGGYADSDMSTECYRVLTSWSSATVDTRRNRLLFRGDGHDGQNDGAVFSLDLTSRSRSVATCGGRPCEISSDGGAAGDPIGAGVITRLNDPSVFDPTIACAPNADGAPLAMQTYGAWIYLPKSDQVFFHGFANRCDNTNDGGNVWLFDLATLTWAKKAAMYANSSGTSCVLDPAAPDDSVLCLLGNKELVRYDVATDTVTALTTWGANWNDGDGINSAATPVLDPDTRTLYVFGNGPWGPDLYAIDLADPMNATRLAATATGCDDLIGNNYPSLVWDPRLRKIVGYVPMTAAAPGVADNRVLVYDPATNSCSTVASGGGPAAHPSTLAGQGTFGHFNYVPALDRYVLIDDPRLDAYAFSLGGAADTTPPTTPTALVATAESSPAIDLAWAPSSDDVAVVGYRVFRDGAAIGTTTSATYRDGGLAPATAYGYAVSAFDAAGNESPPSATASATTPGAAIADPVHGLGGSTLTCLDRDGDGYGTGPGCLGPDADDLDRDVHDGAGFVAKWGSLRAGLQHLGYAPAHIFFIAPDGSDASADGEPSCRDDETRPCADAGYVMPSVGAGDVLVLRGGVYRFWAAAVGGAAGRPVVYMSYPGELASFETYPSGFDFDNGLAHLVVDGMRFHANGGDACVNLGLISDAIFRHIDASGCEWGVDSELSHDLTIEDNVLHDMADGGGQHGLYLTNHSTTTPATGIVVRRNIAFDNPYTGFQFNGRFSGLVVEQNIAYDNDVAGFSWLTGVSDSTFRDNVAINNAKGLVMFQYQGYCDVYDPTPDCPYGLHGDLIEGFTSYSTGVDRFGVPYQAGFPAIDIGDAATNHADMGHNTFRNLNLVGYHGDGGGFAPIAAEDASQAYFATSTFDHVNLFNASTPAGTAAFTVDRASYTCEQAAAAPSVFGSVVACTFADPRFVDASTGYAQTPERFDLRLRATSPALHAGTIVGAPAYDILGTPFADPPSLGAYETPAAVAPPTVALTAPAAGAISTAPATIAVAAAVSGAVDRVEFASGGTTIGSATEAPYAMTWTGVAVGSYTLTARASGADGAATSAPITITVVAANGGSTTSGGTTTDGGGAIGASRRHGGCGAGAGFAVAMALLVAFGARRSRD